MSGAPLPPGAPLRNPPFVGRGALPFSDVAIVVVYRLISEAIDEGASRLRVEDSVSGWSVG